LGETLGVHEAEEAARLSESPAIRAALTTIARDESRHAELAWRFLGWAIATGGSATRAAVREAVAAALAQGEQGGPNARAIDEQLVPYGRLSAARRRRLRREVLERVIGPAFDELWAEGRGRRSSVLQARGRRRRLRPAPLGRGIGAAFDVRGAHGVGRRTPVSVGWPRLRRLP